MKEIPVNELTERLAAGEAMSVIDIRDGDDYADWHIPGATNVPVIRSIRAGDPGPLTAASQRLPRDRPAVVVCNEGISSLKATGVLEPLGFDVVSLAGGMRQWSMATTEARADLAKHPEAVLIQVRRNGKGCLSYVLGSKGAGCVVDPSVSEQTYLAIAEREGLRIERVVETHVHADHVSRARGLAQQTGAALCLPVNGRVTFEYTQIKDGDTFQVGDLEIKAITTPGHTGESTCYLVNDEILLTGDTLFVDSVGRPDLEKGDAGAEAGAQALYRSLHDRILTLPDSLRVFPCHTGGAIGFDGVPIESSLGAVRSMALLAVDEPTFVTQTVAGLGPKPPSYDQVIQINEGKTPLDDKNPLDVEAGPNRCAAQ
jgi:glyoxylase-like metal-dependent hydrolase (beta-lactamase superfamily II)